MRLGTHGGHGQATAKAFEIQASYGRRAQRQISGKISGAAVAHSRLGFQKDLVVRLGTHRGHRQATGKAFEIEASYGREAQREISGKISGAAVGHSRLGFQRI